MKTKIQDYITIPDKKNYTLVQAKVQTALVHQVVEIMEKKGITWRKLMEACFMAFIAENNKRDR